MKRFHVLLDEGAVSCCCTRGVKHWVTDPQGIAWQHFHTLANIPTISEKSATVPQETEARACCAAAGTKGKPVAAPVEQASACC